MSKKAVKACPKTQSKTSVTSKKIGSISKNVSEQSLTDLSQQPQGSQIIPQNNKKNAVKVLLDSNLLKSDDQGVQLLSVISSLNLSPKEAQDIILHAASKRSQKKKLNSVKKKAWGIVKKTQQLYRCLIEDNKMVKGSFKAKPGVSLADIATFFEGVNRKGVPFTAWKDNETGDFIRGSYEETKEESTEDIDVY